LFLILKNTNLVGYLKIKKMSALEIKGGILDLISKVKGKDLLLKL